MDLVPFIAEKFGLLAASAICLNILMLGALIGLGKWFARHVLNELKAIRALLGEEIEGLRDRISDHGERLARLEARVVDDRVNHNYVRR